MGESNNVDISGLEVDIPTMIIGAVALSEQARREIVEYIEGRSDALLLYDGVDDEYDEDEARLDEYNASFEGR